ncbi:hypothetical protein J7I98_04495 [Streptomyces sp. ISL-98]|uniref:hypothetical protein n=1 Tax=Streptomyces sp. ISL-98 TaxID=2819192 RepID=UPI001BEA3F4F|nr:hypothetical protein [Streptomyces sp. ISL-98]MBT2505168.1 hypothetical protein [Streptomyces sp. ISL-98]
MTPQESTQVAVELERLRGTVAEGFATLNGRLDTTLQRTGQVEKDVAELESRVAALERARWPLPSLAALVAVAGLVLALIPRFSA